jgi:hypothetical protein
MQKHFSYLLKRQGLQNRSVFSVTLMTVYHVTRDCGVINLEKYDFF